MDNYEPTRLGGAYIGRILNGEEIADLPVQSASKYILTINQSTAIALGIEIPLELSVFADALVE